MHKLFRILSMFVQFVTQFRAPDPVLGYLVRPRPITGSKGSTQNPTQTGLGLGFTGSCGRLPVLRQHQAFGSVLQHQGLAAPDTQSGATMLQRECCSTVNSANTTNLVICISYIEKPVILGYFIYSKQEIWKRSLLYLFNYLRFICSSQYIYIYYHLSDTSVAYINASYYFV